MRRLDSRLLRQDVAHQWNGDRASVAERNSVEPGLTVSKTGTDLLGNRSLESTSGDARALGWLTGDARPSLTSA
jgi:hypothetical protein